MSDIMLDLSYDSADQIPEGFKTLYQENEGKFVLSKVNNLKTPKDISNLQEALRKERDDHKNAREALSSYTSLGKLEEIQARLDKITELEAAAEGKIDDDKINKLVEGRLIQKTAPLERDLKNLSTERDNLKKEIDTLKGHIETRDRNDAVRAAATEMKVVQTAIQDIELVAANYLEKNESGKFVTRADIEGITPGVDVKQFLKEMQKLRPHWWPASQGGGANGAGGLGNGEPNPWSHEGWNLTKQGQVYNSDPGLAARLAQAAGTSVGGVRPAARK